MNRCRSRIPKLAICAVLGAALGVALDGIHAYGDVLSYPDPAFGRWAWFVPLEFGLLGLGAGIAMPAIERALAGDATPQLSFTRRIAEVVWFGLLYASTVAVDGHGAAPALLALALAALAVARVRLGHAPGDWFYALVPAIAGPCVESLMSAADLFSYAHPDFAHIPVWLAPLWANGGLMLRRVLAPIALADQPAR